MAYAFITQIRNVRKHSNADRLMVGECFGNQVIVSLGTNEGDIGVYFATDSQINEEYCRKNRLLRDTDENGNNVGGYLDPKKRNIRALKLRGEMSDGLFMPIGSLAPFTDISNLHIGDCIDTIGDFILCKKYVPIRQNKTSNNKSNKRKKVNLVEFPFFEEHKDTAQYAYNKHRFKQGDLLTISLKMHGTSGRTSKTIQRTNFKPTLINRALVKAKLMKPFKDTESIVSGTRRTILTDFKGGYYGNDDFRKKYHNFFDGKLQLGETVYYEIVGYVDENKPIMAVCDNKKTHDKEFVKKYGDRTVFNYGCAAGENEIYVYRMTYTSPSGEVFEYPTWKMARRCEQMGVNMVPILRSMIFEDLDDLDKIVNELIVGTDPIGKTHIREGVVIRVENREDFVAFKHKSFEFKLLEGIIKDAGIMDTEEVESLKEE